jgi:hypothetical protein
MNRSHKQGKNSITKAISMANAAITGAAIDDDGEVDKRIKSSFSLS